MKQLLLPAFVLCTLTASSQCSELFFSEYLEGSSNNKAIEIYNPASTAVNLNDYVIYRYNNGSPTPSDSLFPQDILAGGDVWVAGNPSAVSGILAQSDTLHTITFFNGDDALSLKRISTNTVLDIIGIIGTDPGVNWAVGTGATSEFTLVRMTGIQEGNLNWTVAATEYDVYPQNTLTSLGTHTMTPCCTAPSLQLLTQINPGCSGDSTGTIQINGSGTGPLSFAWNNRPETTPYLTNVPAGTYTIYITGTCGSDSMTIALTEPSLLEDSLVDSADPWCNTSNGMLQISGVGGTAPYSYLWNTGDSDDSISGVPAGTYTAVITDANGCIDSSILVLNNPPAPAVALNFTSPDTLCAGSPQIVLMGGSPSGGIYSGTMVTSDSLFNSTSTGWNIVTYTYTDSMNCAGSAVDSIWVDACLGLIENHAPSFTVAPNPFAGTTSVVFPATGAHVIELYTVHGQCLLREQINGNQYTLQMEDAPAGIYFLRVIDGQTTTTQRIQKSE